MFEILPNLGTCSIFESCTPEGWLIIDVRDLSDDGKNKIEDVANKISLVANLMYAGCKVVIRCQAGISRSNTIACAAMVYGGVFKYWDDAWKATQEACPRAWLNMDFFDAVRKALRSLYVNEERL